jgi:6-phosphogluconolactonase (cycloisomerase 2 family)
MEVKQLYAVRPRLKLVPLLAAATLFTLQIFWPQAGLAQGSAGNVYVLTNQPSGNAVMVFHRDADGILSFAGRFASGGTGGGGGIDPLSSQGAVVLSEDGSFLLAVNAGSDSISLFAVCGDTLTLIDTVSSGGVAPVSLTVRQNLVYVVNAGETPNIAGFTIANDMGMNQLVPLAGSTQPLPGGADAGPAQVSFSPDGRVLLVTERGTDTIDTFTLDDEGIAQPGVSFASSGSVPFGFGFGQNNIAVVSEAAEAALSSYQVDVSGNLSLVTGSLVDTQAGACWVVVTENGRFAYTSNTGSNTISSYAIDDDGSLMLLDVVAADAGEVSAPTDMALSANSPFLYVRNGGDGTISGFYVEDDGSLTLVSTANGLPSGAVGIAAR